MLLLKDAKSCMFGVNVSQRSTHHSVSERIIKCSTPTYFLEKKTAHNLNNNTESWIQFDNTQHGARIARGIQRMLPALNDGRFARMLLRLLTYFFASSIVV